MKQWFRRNQSAAQAQIGQARASCDLDGQYSLPKYIICTSAGFNAVQMNRAQNHVGMDAWQTAAVDASAHVRKGAPAGAVHSTALRETGP